MKCRDVKVDRIVELLSESLYAIWRAEESSCPFNHRYSDDWLFDSSERLIVLTRLSNFRCCEDSFSFFAFRTQTMSISHHSKIRECLCQILSMINQDEDVTIKVVSLQANKGSICVERIFIIRIKVIYLFGRLDSWLWDIVDNKRRCFCIVTKYRSEGDRYSHDVKSEGLINLKRWSSWRHSATNDSSERRCLIIVSLNADWATFTARNIWLDSRLTWNVQIEIRVSNWRVFGGYWREDRFTNLWVAILSKSRVSRGFEPDEDIKFESEKLHARCEERRRIAV